MTTTIPRTLAVLIIVAALAGCVSPNDPSSEGTDPSDPTSPSDSTTDDGTDASDSTSSGDTSSDDGTDASDPPSSGTSPTNESPTADVPAGPAAVNLGSAADYVILAKSGVSTTGTTSIVGDIGVSPASGTAITGFGLIMDASNEFSTSSLVSGRIHAADYAPPTPTTMTTAIGDMENAYLDAAGRSDPTATELGAGSIGSMTLAPGLYKWSTGVNVVTDVTLSGGADDVWIFQIAQDLLVDSGAKVVLSGGAQARNVFFQVAGQSTLSVGSDVHGNILGHSAIVLNTGATLTGRALSQTAVTLDANEIVVAP